MNHLHKTDDAAGDAPQACHYAALGIVGVTPNPKAAEVNAQRRRQLDAHLPPADLKVAALNGTPSNLHSDMLGRVDRAITTLKAAQ